MNVLGIETSTEVCSTGIADESGIIANYLLNRGYTHAEMLPDAVKHILHQSNILIKDLDGIAVSIGPGSFTGLRIGIGFAKGLAKGYNIPLIGVPTFDALIRRVPFAAEFAVAFLKSRKGEYYRAVYKQDREEWVLKGDYKVVAEKDIIINIPVDTSVIITGHIDKSLESKIKDSIKNVIFTNYDYFTPNGFSIASEGVKYLIKGNVSDASSLVPIYLNKYLGVS